jgi:hypothetical protein
MPRHCRTVHAEKNTTSNQLTPVKDVKTLTSPNDLKLQYIQMSTIIPFCELIVFLWVELQI